MCNAISGIMRSDGTTFFPRLDAWNHSHTAIAKENGIPDGEMGDRYARFEITPADGDYRSDQASWLFKLDEPREPAWWPEDKPALEDKARRDALRWFRSFPDNLVPGFKCTGGDYSKLTGGDGSTLAGGDYSTLTGGYGSTLAGGDYSKLTGGDGSTLTGGDGSTLTGGHGSTLAGGDGSTLTGGHGSTLAGGDYSTLTGGDGSTLTGGDGSTLAWRYWDGKRYRTVVRYTGEDGIEAGKKYVFRNGNVFQADGGAA